MSTPNTLQDGPFSALLFQENALVYADDRARELFSEEELSDPNTFLRLLKDANKVHCARDHTTYAVSIRGIPIHITEILPEGGDISLYILQSSFNDIFPFIMENLLNELSISNGEGVVLWVSESWQQKHKTKAADVIGLSSKECEERGIFRPSVALEVIRTGKRSQIIQYNKDGEQLLTSGVPVFSADGAIEWIICYNTWDIGNFRDLQEKYSEVKQQAERYSAEVEELRSINMDMPDIIANSPQMKNVIALIKRVAKKDISVMITGETGVGKSLVAKTIHQISSRAEGPFVEINCGAIPETLLESELFGYQGGAFTGANKGGKIGLIEMANNGTLFLDEIGEMSMALQVKLLHTIQEKQITRVGGTRPIDVDFRLITATNKDLKALIQQNQFREDLFYRINGVPIEIPPLRDRREDLQSMIPFFMEKANIKYDSRRTLSPEATQILMMYDWPGNTRELENVIERIVVLTNNDYITTAHLPIDLLPKLHSSTGKIYGLQQMLELYEQNIIQNAFAQHKTTVGVAKALGISQPTAARKITKYVK